MIVTVDLFELIIFSIFIGLIILLVLAYILGIIYYKIMTKLHIYHNCYKCKYYHLHDVAGMR